MTILPTYFISHGGELWPLMKAEYGQTYAKLEIALQDISRQPGITPKPVLVISVHWGKPEFTVMANAMPDMIYDFSDFPEYTYQINYPASSSPELAYQVWSLSQQAGFPAKLDLNRGFDHGMYSALYPIYPEADVPIVQLSLKIGLDPAMHLAMGRALASLRTQGILITGSGLSYHNMCQFGRQVSSHYGNLMIGCSTR